MRVLYALHCSSKCARPFQNRSKTEDFPLFFCISAPDTEFSRSQAGIILVPTMQKNRPGREMRTGAVWQDHKNWANTEAPTTVSRPETAMDRLLMAPSTSPISMALAVPRAWAEEPMAIPLAMGS